MNSKFVVFVKSLTVVGLVFMSLYSTSQTKEVDVNYISNTPKRIKSLMVGYNYGFNSENPMFMSHGLDVNYNNSNFKLGFSYETNLMKPGEELQTDLVNIKSVFNKFEIGMGLGFWGKVRSEKIKVEYSAGYGSKWKVNVPVKAYKIKGLHTGFSLNRSYIEVNDNFFDYNKPSLFVGYYWAKYSNYEFEVDKRFKSGKRYHESYIDIFYAPQISNEYVQKNTKYTPFGARIGTNVHSLRHLGFDFKFEAGVLPRNFSESSNRSISFYLKSGIGINLCLRKEGTPFDKSITSDIGKTDLKSNKKSGSEQSAYELISTGEVYYKAEKYNMAIEKFEAGLAKIGAPGKSQASTYYFLGDSYFNTVKDSKEYTKVIELMKKSYELDPTYNVMVPVVVFVCEKALNNFDEAAIWYQKSLSHNGCNEKLRALLIDWNTEMQKSKTQFEEGKKLKQSPIDAKVSNMGVSVNGSFDDYFPSITADESMFIFTSSREGSTGGKNSKDEYDEDLWYCEKISDSLWSQPKNMGKPVNTETNNGTASFTGDGQFVVTGRCGDMDGFGSCDNYFSFLTGNTWSIPKNMGSKVNSTLWDGQACISVDGKVLIFSSKRSGGYGETDLWMCKKDSIGEWLSPINLGSVINTKGNEYSPYLHPDGKTLFFSSNSHSPCIGGQDIYKSTLQDNGSWSKPENLGYPINTENSELYFILAPSGITGYFASNRDGGFGGIDIYRVDFPKTKMSKLVTVVGFVTDETTGQPISAEIQIEDVEKNEIVGNYKSNEITGKFVIVLTPGRNYSLTVNKKEYLFYSENFDIADTNQFIEVKKDIRLQKLAVGKKIVLNNIFFESGKSDLKTESEIEINRLYELLTENPNIVVEISGHTDNIGDDKSNMSLSQARAEVVVKALLTKGIPVKQLISKGYGETMPVSTNDTEDGRLMNRRTEFKIISQ